ncbi:MAG TPA: hypothetical protein VJP02_13205 [Candidatus Sulfotelmatobacter sp.]|nr:hypothetical protein [Candidatus Sulfotelmatobacter sp.]
MGRIKQQIAGVAFVMVALLLLSACSINVKKEKNGQDKQVDISTPMGGIHVSKGVNPEDVGIAVYPGSTLKEEDNGENKSANVNLSSFGFGLKVVALEYESKDSPEKVVAFYKGQLTKYGDVLVCHTTRMNVNPGMRKQDDGSHQLTCEGDSGHNIELKVGTKENQHIVAVEPSDSGTNFSLVYVRTHGKEAEI